MMSEKYERAPTLPKGTDSQKMKLEKNLQRSSKYEMNGRTFLVTPVFRQEGSETLGSVLLKLMQMTSSQ